MDDSERAKDAVRVETARVREKHCNRGMIVEMMLRRIIARLSVS